jgi:hypothetical protein
MLNWNQSNFFVSAFFGNDAASLSHLAFGPGRARAALGLGTDNPTNYNLFSLGKYLTGRIPTGGILYKSGGFVMTRYGWAINMVGASRTLSMTGAAKVGGGVLGAFSAGKAFFDVPAYLYSEVVCAER